MPKTCRLTGMFMLAAFIFVAPHANAIEEISRGLFSDNAISGYDPVAYFTESRAVKGKEKYATKWHGVTWIFANEKNRDEFKKYPEAYAPQYGGYSAMGMAHGKAEMSDPKAWQVIGEKLYLNNDRFVHKTWQKNAHKHISQADINWRGFAEHK